MQFYPLLFGTTFGIALVAGMLHLVIGLGRPRSTVHLLFAAAAVSYGLQALACYAMSQAGDAGQYVALFKFAYGPTSTVGILALFWFGAFYTDVRPYRFLWAITIIFVTFALLPHLLLPTGALVNVTGIRQVRLGWGETITLHAGGVTALQPVITLLIVTISAFYAYALYRQWRRGERVAAIFLAFPALIFFLISSVHGRLIDAGLIDSPYLGGVGIIAISIPLSLKLAHDAVQGRRSLRVSEQRLLAFVTHTQEAIWTIDFERPLPLELPLQEQTAHFRRHSGRVSDCNDAMARVMGYESSEALIGRPLSDFFSLSLPENAELLERVVSAGFRINGAVSPIVVPGGGVRYLEGRLTPIVEEGSVVRIWGAARDVTDRLRMVEELRQHREELADLVDARTVELQRANARLSREIAERQRAETELRNSRRFLRSVLNSLPYQIVVINEEGDIVEVNRAWCRAADKGNLAWKGYGLGRNYLDVLDNAPDQAPTSRAIRAILAGERESYSLEYPCADLERELWYVMHVTRAATDEVLAIISHVEITERVKAEKALQDRETLLRQTLDLLPVGVWLTDETGKIVTTNPAGRKIWGDEEAVAAERFSEYRGWWVETGEPIAAEEWAVERALVHGETSIREMIEIETTEGRHKFLLNSAVPLRGEQQEITGSIVVNEDITALRQAEVALQRRVEELAALHEIAGTLAGLPVILESLPRVAESVTSLFRVDATHILLSDKRSGELLMLGFDRAQGSLPPAPVGRTVSEMPALSTLLAEQSSEAITNESRADIMGAAETLLQAPQIETLLAMPLLVAGRSVGVMLLTGAEPRRTFTKNEVDLAETIATDIAVAVANLHLLEQREEKATLEERQRITAELHDSVTQTIYSASIMAEGLGRLVAHEKMAEIEWSARQLRLMTLGALAEMRTLLFELRPAALAETRLPVLLQQLGDVLTGRLRVPVDLVVQSGGEPPVDVKLAVYRIAQESFNNIAKHAEARRVTVWLRSTSEVVEMRIADDGRGFDPATDSEGRMGLQIMAERAEGIGAELRIDSNPGGGAEVVLHWKAR